MELIDVTDHLHESQPDNSGLCVVTKSQTVDEASRARDDVLQRTADLNSLCVLDHRHAEVRRLHAVLHDRTDALVLAT